MRLEEFANVSNQALRHQIFGIIILRSMRWVRHVECMREKRKACSILVENREGRGYSEY